MFGAWCWGEGRDKARGGGRAHSIARSFGILPQAVCLSVLGEVKEGKKQTGIEIESLRGRLALALRLKKDKAPAFRKHTA